MPNAMAEALAAEIEKRDVTHENLEILDEIVHQLLEMTKPLRTLDDDCNCGKRKTAEGIKPYE
jgi:hypothetical protein